MGGQVQRRMMVYLRFPYLFFFFNLLLNGIDELLVLSKEWNEPEWCFWCFWCSTYMGG